jgi:hypothetical protein
MDAPMDHAVTTTSATTSQQPFKNINKIIKEINQLRHIVQIEKELTQGLQNVEPYLWSSYRTLKHTTPHDHDDVSTNDDIIPPDVLKILQEREEQSCINSSSHHIRIRPIPRTMGQVQAILSLGRSYSNRTSAPAGWTSTTPLIHFTTPNPLPHQLRHSALATLQLQRTIDAGAAKEQQERATRLKRKLEQEASSKRALKSQNNSHNNDIIDMDTSMDVSTKDTAGSNTNQRPLVVPSYPQSTPVVSSSILRPRLPPRTTQISMNLSDDESSDDDDNE